MNKVLSLIFLLISSIGSWAQCPTSGFDYESLSSATRDWEDAGDWSGGVSPPFTIPAGVIVRVTTTGGMDVASSIVVNGTLILDGKLNMALGTSITINAGGYVCCTGICNPSDKLTIGGSPVWDGDSPPVSGPAFSDGSTVLPIVLSYFRVSIPKDEKQTLIEWATESEENFDHFEIQRAGSDLKFTSIITVPGAGYSTNSLQEYTSYDKDPLVGTGYYRLKAVDINGSAEYFSVRSVTFNGGRNFYVTPNPTSGSSITYNINFDPSPYDRVVLIDAVGNELLSRAVTGSSNELIPNKTLAPGAYLLRYVSANHQHVARVFIKE